MAKGLQGTQLAVVQQKKKMFSLKSKFLFLTI